MAITAQSDGADVVTARTQGLLVSPALDSEVGDKKASVLARRADDLGRDFAAPGGFDIDRD